MSMGFPLESLRGLRVARARYGDVCREDEWVSAVAVAVARALEVEYPHDEDEKPCDCRASIMEAQFLLADDGVTRYCDSSGTARAGRNVRHEVFDKLWSPN
jgi:hypothetical protein